MIWTGTSLLLLLLSVHHYEHNGLHGVLGNFIIRGLPQKRYTQLADVNIGVLLPMTEAGTDGQRYCNDDRISAKVIKHAEVKILPPTMAASLA